VTPVRFWLSKQDVDFWWRHRAAVPSREFAPETCH